MDSIPDYAIVNEAVRLAKKKKEQNCPVYQCSFKPCFSSASFPR
ncbi:MAG: hypothetical protein ACLUIS_02220 [Longibaculum sp.]